MFGANDNLSKAASAVLRIERHSEVEYSLDGSGELGDRIAHGIAEAKRKAVAEYGFTPLGFNAALRERLAPEYPHMSYGTFHLLGLLEVETLEEERGERVVATGGNEESTLAFLYGDSHPCPRCGQPINSSTDKLCLDCQTAVEVSA